MACSKVTRRKLLLSNINMAAWLRFAKLYLLVIGFGHVHLAVAEWIVNSRVY